MRTCDSCCPRRSARLGALPQLEVLELGGLLPLQLVQIAALLLRQRARRHQRLGQALQLLQRSSCDAWPSSARARRLGGASGGGGGGGGGGGEQRRRRTDRVPSERMPSGSHWRGGGVADAGMWWTPGASSPPSSSSSSSWSIRAKLRTPHEMASRRPRVRAAPWLPLSASPSHASRRLSRSVRAPGSMSSPSSSSTNGARGLCVASARRPTLLLAAPAQSLERWRVPAVRPSFLRHTRPGARAARGSSPPTARRLLGLGAGRRRRRNTRAPSLPAPRPADGARTPRRRRRRAAAAQQPNVPVALPRRAGRRRQRQRQRRRRRRCGGGGGGGRGGRGRRREARAGAAAARPRF